MMKLMDIVGQDLQLTMMMMLEATALHCSVHIAVQKLFASTVDQRKTALALVYHHS